MKRARMSSQNRKCAPSAGVAMIRRLAIAVVGAGMLAFPLIGGATAEAAKAVPAPADDIAATGQRQTAVFAGGCFWSVQAAYQHVAGVVSATTGYAGGDAATATYEATETGRTGHAEAVQIVFDPAKVSYGTLLQIFFSAVHDPTQAGGQGSDIGPQYRSAVFPLDAAQRRVASGYIAQLDAAGVFEAPIATTIEPGKAFYRAEAYHQDYVVNHAGTIYVRFHELPKLDAVRRLFPALYREQPVLVSAAAGAGGADDPSGQRSGQ